MTKIHTCLPNLSGAMTDLKYGTSTSTTNALLVMMLAQWLNVAQSEGVAAANVSPAGVDAVGVKQAVSCSTFDVLPISLPDIDTSYFTPSV